MFEGRLSLHLMNAVSQKCLEGFSSHVTQTSAWNQEYIEYVFEKHVWRRDLVLDWEFKLDEERKSVIGASLTNITLKNRHILQVCCYLVYYRFIINGVKQTKGFTHLQ